MSEAGTVVLRLRGVTKSFPDPAGGGGGVVPVLRVGAFELARGDHVGLCGPSGSGKTTLLHLIAGVLRADGPGGGATTATSLIEVAGTDIGRLSEAKRDRHRARHVGYVFQTFQLLPGFTALENVLLAMRFAGAGLQRDRAEALLKRVGLAERMHFKPPALSHGQQQRVAVARAVANRPSLVLADEPTGNLDAQQREVVLSVIRDACRECDAALLLVSHDHDTLAPLDRVVSLAELNR